MKHTDKRHTDENRFRRERLVWCCITALLCIVIVAGSVFYLAPPTEGPPPPAAQSGVESPEPGVTGGQGDKGDNTLRIPQNPTPAASPEFPLASGGTWSLLSLVLALPSIVLALFLLISGLLRMMDKSRPLDGWRLCGALAGGAAVLVFPLTYTAGGKMVWADGSTALITLVVAFQIYCAFKVWGHKTPADSADAPY